MTLQVHSSEEETVRRLQLLPIFIDSRLGLKKEN